MTRKSIKSMVWFIVMVVAISSFLPGEKVKTTYLNLDFEDIGWKGKPRLWFVGGRGYQGEVVETEKQSGKSSLFIHGEKKENNFGVATSLFPIEDARGKKLRFSGYIKTESVTGGYAGLWWRVDGMEGDKPKVVAFDNMGDRGVVGTTGWQEYTIEMDIPVAGKAIYFGLLLTGSGKAWYDNLQVRLDGQLYLQERAVEVLPKQEELEWIKTHAVTFGSVEPGASHEELMPLKKMIGKRRIVALGEGTHGTSEFFKMKHRLTRFLAEEMDFTIFAIEANMPEARKVNHYVLTGEGDPKEALAGLYFWTWNTAEVLDMIEWMRAYNKSGKGRIEFYGFDMQFVDVAIEGVSGFIKKAEPGYVSMMESLYGEVKDQEKVNRAKRSNGSGEYTLWYEAAKKVYDHVVAKREEYIKVYKVEEVEWVIQDANIVVQAAECNMEGKRSRDESMAENLEWILQHAPQGTKVVTWAHNGHVCKSGEYFKPMGQFLEERYKGDMIVFGFAFHQGTYTAVGENGISVYDTSPSEPGSVEWFFKSTGMPRFILDLRTVSEGEPGSQWLKQSWDFRSIGALAMDYGFSSRVVIKDYDAIIYIENSTPSGCFRFKPSGEKKAAEVKK